MKLQRWGLMFNNGAWCKSDDVAELESSQAELLAAAKDIVAWQDGKFGYDLTPQLHRVINRLRAAVAKAEGEVMP